MGHAASFRENALCRLPSCAARGRAPSIGARSATRKAVVRDRRERAGRALAAAARRGGFAAGQSTVTVLAAEAPHQCYDRLSNTAEGVLTTLEDSRAGGRLPSWSDHEAGTEPGVVAADRGGAALCRLPVPRLTQPAVRRIARRSSLRRRPRDHGL